MGVQFMGTNHARMIKHGDRGTFPQSVRPETHFDFSNMNARAFLRLLGIEQEDLHGEMPIPDARRLVIRARASFARRAPLLVRPSTTCAITEAGYVECGIDEAYLARRLEEFERLLVALQARGATHIEWS